MIVGLERGTVSWAVARSQALIVLHIESAAQLRLRAMRDQLYSRSESDAEGP